MKRIAIVGGGPGGLFSALLLRQKCRETPEITLFEASSRLGGKLLTKHFETVPVPYEAGAAELYQYGRDPLRLLIKETLGLPVVSMGGRAVVMDGHILRSLADVERHYGPATVEAIEQFDALAHAVRPYDQFYDGGWTADNDQPLFDRTLASLLADIPDEAARRYLKVLIHSDLASEPHCTSALYGLDNYLINDPRYCKLYSIRGGLERLIDSLRGEIRAEIRLETPVERIEKCAGETYRIVFRNNGECRSEEFDSVVVALPHAWLPNIAWGGNRLEAAMDAHLAHYDHPAHYLRISLLFRSPFWRQEFNESYFMIDAFGGCCVYDEGARHDTSGYGVLAWLLAGNNAFAANNVADDRLIAMALDSLPKEISAGRELFIEGHVHRWLGSVSARPGGTTIKGLDERHVPEPIEHAGLFVVGDYMFDTSINGALDSADFATDLLIETLGLERACVDNDYFDDYYNGATYAESYAVAFDPHYVVDAIEAVWGARPPYRLLDAGAACGLTLRALDKLGVEAWGIENNPYIHAQTPRPWKSKNRFGDVRALPFEDDSFDFVYETCLAFLPEADLAQAIRELKRVARKGLIFGSFTTDLPADLVEKHDLRYGVRTELSLDRWMGLFAEHGLTPEVNDAKTMARLWATRTRAFGGKHPHTAPTTMSHCFLKTATPAQILNLPAPVAATTSVSRIAL